MAQWLLLTSPFSHSSPLLPSPPGPSSRCRVERGHILFILGSAALVSNGGHFLGGHSHSLARQASDLNTNFTFYTFDSRVGICVDEPRARNELQGAVECQEFQGTPRGPTH